jgi:hypothetical protein
MNTTLSINCLFFTSALTALALIWSARQAEAAASGSSDTSGTWTATGALVAGGYARAATLLADGDVLLAGRPGDCATNSEVYEVASGKWTTTSPLNECGCGHTLTLLPNGKVLAAGGYNSKDGRLSRAVSNAELFDPVSRTWTKTGAMNSVHGKHTATLLPNGKVLVTGNNYRTNDFVVTEWYDEATGKLTHKTSVIETLPPNGKGQLAGYYDRTNDFASAELYDPATGTWKRIASLNQPRAHHTATLLTNGLVLVVGGDDKQGTALSSAELYDPTAETWTEVHGLQLARGYHTATLLTTGKVLVLGGQGGDGKPFSEAELFDPVTRRWAAAGAMRLARSYHTATLLENGKVLVAGGSSFGGSLKFVEVYDPANGAWTRARPMATARHWHTATLLQNGKVLIAGGTGTSWSDSLSSAELFDPLSRER